MPRDDSPITEQVAAMLRTLHIPATVEYPGFVAIDLGPDHILACGDGATWGWAYEVQHRTEGPTDQNGELDVTPDSQDVAAIVAAIEPEYRRFRRIYGNG